MSFLQKLGWLHMSVCSRLKIPWRRERLPTPVFWTGEFPWTIVHGIAKSRTRLNDFHFASPVIMGHACSVGTGGYTGQSNVVT